MNVWQHGSGQRATTPSACPARSGLDDREVAAWAEREDRVLLSHDTDFGAVAVAMGRPLTGIILVRASVSDPDATAGRLLRLIGAEGERLGGRVTVLSDRSIRSRSIA